MNCSAIKIGKKNNTTQNGEMVYLLADTDVQFPASPIYLPKGNGLFLFSIWTQEP